MGPVCTIMVGRLDDWLKVVADKRDDHAWTRVPRVGGRRGLQEGVRALPERGYRLRLLSAAFRNHMHWSEFIGGDVVISPPYEWQVRFNASDVPVVPRIDQRRSIRASSQSFRGSFRTSGAPRLRTG